jgi:hypothetical protein
MSLYTSMLFLHVSAAICLFVGMGVWVVGMVAIGLATRVEQVRALGDLMLMVRLVVPASALLVIVAGGTMTRIAWGLGLASSILFVLAGRTTSSDRFDPHEEHSA